MTAVIQPAEFALPRRPPRQFHWASDDPTLGAVRRASFGLPFQGTLPVDAPPRVSRFDVLKIEQQLAEPRSESPGQLREIVERLLGRGIHTPVFDALLPLAARLAAGRETTRHAEFQEKLATSHDCLHRLGCSIAWTPVS